MATAIAHPKVMTIQPEFSAFDLASSTAATTPSPRRIRTAVPMISPPMMLKWDLGRTSTTAPMTPNSGLLSSNGLVDRRILCRIVRHCQTKLILLWVVRQCRSSYVHQPTPCSPAGPRGVSDPRDARQHPIHRARGDDSAAPLGAQPATRRGRHC